MEKIPEIPRGLAPRIFNANSLAKLSENYLKNSLTPLLFPYEGEIFVGISFFFQRI